MKKLKIFWIIVLYFTLTIASAQQYENFYVIKSNIENSYDSLLQIYGVDSMQGTDYYPNMRWINYWEPLVYPSGDFLVEFQKQEQYIAEFLNGDYPTSSTSFELDWQLIGPDVMPIGGSRYMKGLGQIHFIAFDPNDPTYQNLFACSPVGGLWRSENGGDSWFNAGTDKGLPLCGVSSIAIDPDNSNSWYVSTGDGDGLNRGWQKSVGVWHTQDEGITWEFLGLEDVNYMRKIVLKKHQDVTHLFVATTSGIFEWNDSDSQFTKLISGDFYDVELDPQNSGIVYASGCGLNTSVHKIDWINDIYIELPNISSIQQDPNRRLIINISPAASNYMFIVATYKGAVNTSHLYRYDLTQETLLPKGELPHASLGEPGVGPERAMGWAISPVLNSAGELIMLHGNTAPIRQSNDLLDDNPSCTWDDVTSVVLSDPYRTCKIHVDMHYMVFTPDGQTLWVGNDGGVYKSSMPDLVNNWEEKNTGLAVATVDHCAVSNHSEDILLSGNFDNGSILYKRYPTSWYQRHVVGGDGFQCCFDYSDSERMFVSDQYSLHRSTNEGLTFQDMGGFFSLCNIFYSEQCVSKYIIWAKK